MYLAEQQHETTAVWKHCFLLRYYHVIIRKLDCSAFESDLWLVVLTFCPCGVHISRSTCRNHFLYPTEQECWKQMYKYFKFGNVFVVTDWQLITKNYQIYVTDYKDSWCQLDSQFQVYSN